MLTGGKAGSEHREETDKKPSPSQGSPGFHVQMKLVQHPIRFLAGQPLPHSHFDDFYYLC